MKDLAMKALIGAALFASASCKNDAASSSTGAAAATSASARVEAATTATAAPSASTLPMCVEPAPENAPYQSPLKNELMPTPEGVAKALVALQKRYPCSSRLVELGRSHLGRPIHALEIGRGSPEGKPTFFLNGEKLDVASTADFRAALDAAIRG